ncbi:MAG: YeeE/YedE family protein [Yoonia sp.]|nr:YeeE/YedE family protein [Yoonia sp.]
MFDLISDNMLVALIAGAGGILLGLAARLGRFCTLGAIEDYLYGDNDTRLRMWGVAIGVSIFGSFLASQLGYFGLSDASYLSQSLNIGASVIGGLIFGYGMALAGNCGFGALARLGGGDLRSLLIVLVMGLSALFVLSGPLGYANSVIFPRSADLLSVPSIAHGIHAITGISVSVIGIVIGLGVIILSLATRRNGVIAPAVLWGGIVGLAIVSGWIGTDLVARNGFDATPIVSHTFSAPIGASMLYAMTASGTAITFGVGSVVGVLLGSFVGSLIKGHFKWEACEDPRELRRQIVGAALMGAGAVIALGCSIGQGLSAMSVLAYGAPITLAAIFAGAYVGLKQLIEGFIPVPDDSDPSI